MLWNCWWTVGVTSLAAHRLCMETTVEAVTAVAIDNDGSSLVRSRWARSGELIYDLAGLQALLLKIFMEF